MHRKLSASLIALVVAGSGFAFGTDVFASKEVVVKIGKCETIPGHAPYPRCVASGTQCDLAGNTEPIPGTVNFYSKECTDFH